MKPWITDKTYLAVLKLRAVGFCVRQSGPDHIVNRVRVTSAQIILMASLARDVRMNEYDREAAE
jgi:DNA-binding NarL/FixJ family response regulator